MNKYIALTLFSSFVSLVSPANANEWQSGWGQGVTEYFVRLDDESSLNLSCPDESRGPITIHVEFNGSPVESPSMVIDDTTFDIDWVLSDCRVCANNYEVMWELLRNAKELKVSAVTGTKSFPVTGLKKTIPAKPCAHASEF